MHQPLTAERVTPNTSAEELAIHEIDDSATDLDEALDALADAVDPEADAIVDDALDIDSVEEADAAGGGQSGHAGCGHRARALV